MGLLRGTAKAERPAHCDARVRGAEPGLARAAADPEA